MDVDVRNELFLRPSTARDLVGDLPLTPRIELFGLPVDRLTMDETIEAVRAMVRTGTPHQHVALNAAVLVEIAHDTSLREIVQVCDLVNADGMSAVWASRILGSPLPQRVAGPDLLEGLVGAATRDGSSVYFLGAAKDVVGRVAEVFLERYPDLRVAGFRDGYWEDDREVVASVRQAAPDYLFLALPSPRKEFWLREHLSEMGVPFVMGVGGAFDVVAGKTARAPKVVQRAGFEWLWRFGQEPTRMWRRYLIGNCAFMRMTWHEWKRLRAETHSPLAAGVS